MLGNFCIRINIYDAHHNLFTPHKSGMHAREKLALLNVGLSVEVFFWKHYTPFKC
jgi:hypothetical protein